MFNVKRQDKSNFKALFPLEYILTNTFDYRTSFSLLGLLLGVYTFKIKEI